MPETNDDKYGILDVCVKTNTGKIINIEIQVVKSAAFFERITFYKSKLIVGQIGENEKYDQIKKTICIGITDFPLIENSAPGRYHLVASGNAASQADPAAAFAGGLVGGYASLSPLGGLAKSKKIAERDFFAFGEARSASALVRPALGRVPYRMSRAGLIVEPFL